MVSNFAQGTKLLLFRRCQLVGRGKVVKTRQVLSSGAGRFVPGNSTRGGVRLLRNEGAELFQICHGCNRFSVLNAGQQHRRYLYGSARRLRRLRLGQAVFGQAGFRGTAQFQG